MSDRLKIARARSPRSSGGLLCVQMVSQQANSKQADSLDGVQIPVAGNIIDGHGDGVAFLCNAQ